jgi:hypothetical protein
MARGWKCPRCSTQNGEGVINCAKCGLIHGGVYVPSTYATPELTGSPEPPTRAETPPEPPHVTAEPNVLPPAALGVGAPLPPTAEAGQPSAAWVPPYPIAPPRSRPLWRRIPLGLVVFGVLIVGGAVAGFITNASRSSTGDITKSGDMSSNDLRVGDCWDMKDPSSDKIDNVTAKPCGEAHEYEVFFIGSMAEGTYPSDDQFTGYVQDNCVPAFGTYVGQTYDSSDLDISWLSPMSEGWAAGDRTVECSVYDPNNSELTASMKATGR